MAGGGGRWHVHLHLHVTVTVTVFGWALAGFWRAVVSRAVQVRLSKEAFLVAVLKDFGLVDDPTLTTINDEYERLVSIELPTAAAAAAPADGHSAADGGGSADGEGDGRAKPPPSLDCRVVYSHLVRQRRIQHRPRRPPVSMAVGGAETGNETGKGGRLLRRALTRRGVLSEASSQQEAGSWVGSIARGIPHVDMSVSDRGFGEWYQCYWRPSVLGSDPTPKLVSGTSPGRGHLPRALPALGHEATRPTPPASLPATSAAPPLPATSVAPPPPATSAAAPLPSTSVAAPPPSTPKVWAERSMSPSMAPSPSSFRAAAAAAPAHTVLATASTLVTTPAASTLVTAPAASTPVTAPAACSASVTPAASAPVCSPEAHRLPLSTRLPLLAPRGQDRGQEGSFKGGKGASASERAPRPQGTWRARLRALV